jgi:lactoylglutathione lyase
MNFKINHIAFIVENMEKSIEFYTKVLGLKKAFELNKEDGSPWIVCLKVSDRQFIEFFHGGLTRPDAAKRPIGYNHFSLEVEDIDEIADRIKSQGILLDSEPKQGKDSNYQCWVRDPDGNRIEFIQLMPGSPHLSC